MKYVKIFWLYVAIVGFVTFPLFILEESIQLATWGTWGAKAAGDYRLELKGVILMERINAMMQTINSAFGWVQPLSMLSYDAYAQATDYYIEATKMKILANEPAAFLDREVEMNFQPKEVKALDDGRFLLLNGKMSAIVERMPELQQVKIKGVLKEVNGKMVVIDGQF